MSLVTSSDGSLARVTVRASGPPLGNSENIRQSCWEVGFGGVSLNLKYLMQRRTTFLLVEAPPGSSSQKWNQVVPCRRRKLRP